MIFEKKEFMLKDGRTAVLRSPEKEDAEKLIEYLTAISEETYFVLRYPEECNYTIEKEENFIDGINSDPNHVMITCFVDGEVAGNCQLSMFSGMKISHRASVAIAQRREFWNLGIGTQMFTEMIRIARERGIMQIELDYIDGNERGKHLYEKMGFVQTGVRPNAIKLRDGALLDEIAMVKVL